MLLRCLKAEVQKCRRSPVWLAFLVLPIFPAILGTGNYLGNLEALENGWYSLWSQHTLFSSMFFLPALLGVFCAWQWRLEHTDHNWNSFLTAPVPVRDLYAAKLILAAVVSLLAQVCIGALFLISGKIAGISGPVPPELPGWLLCGALGGVSVCTVQLFFTQYSHFSPCGISGGGMRQRNNAEMFKQKTGYRLGLVRLPLIIRLGRDGASQRHPVLFFTADPASCGLAHIAWPSCAGSLPRPGRWRLGCS